MNHYATTAAESSESVCLHKYSKCWNFNQATLNIVMSLNRYINISHESDCELRGL